MKQEECVGVWHSLTKPGESQGSRSWGGKFTLSLGCGGAQTLKEETLQRKCQGGKTKAFIFPAPNNLVCTELLCLLHVE